MILLLAFLPSLIGLAYGKVDTSTLNGKHVVGYQGWFRRLGQDDKNSHWQRDNNSPLAPGIPGNVGVDFLPYLDGYPSECLFDTPFMLPNGNPAQFYTTNCDGIVDLHVSMMAQNNVDGPFVQRFYGYIDETDYGGWTNVSIAVHQAAAKYGVGWAIEYDLSSANISGQDNNIGEVLLTDLNGAAGLGFFDNATYFHHNGKPVVELWGFGINKRVTPSAAMDIVTMVKNAGYHVVLGVQQAWRSELQNTTETPYGDVYKVADTIQPWTVGSYGNDNLEGFYTGTQQPDAQELSSLGIGSSIVIWPGSSSGNSLQDFVPGNPSIPVYEKNPRYNGTYYNTQIDHAVSLKPQFIFTAMFDEVNEGTAIMPTLRSNELPTNAQFIGLDDDQDHGYYLTRAGYATQALKMAWGVENLPSN